MRETLSETERRDWLRLARTENVGPVTFDQLLQRFGTATAALAARMPALVWASRNGSIAVEFSGHSTKSGRSTVPASTSRASCTVTSTWFCVTWRKS